MPTICMAQEHSNSLQLLVFFPMCEYLEYVVYSRCQPGIAREHFLIHTSSVKPQNHLDSSSVRAVYGQSI